MEHGLLKPEWFALPRSRSKRRCFFLLINICFIVGLSSQLLIFYYARYLGIQVYDQIEDEIKINYCYIPSLLIIAPYIFIFAFMAFSFIFHGESHLYMTPKLPIMMLYALISLDDHSRECRACVHEIKSYFSYIYTIITIPFFIVFPISSPFISILWIWRGGTQFIYFKWNYNGIHERFGISLYFQLYTIIVNIILYRYMFLYIFPFISDEQHIIFPLSICALISSLAWLAVVAIGHLFNHPNICMIVLTHTLATIYSISNPERNSSYLYIALITGYGFALNSLLIYDEFKNNGPICIIYQYLLKCKDGLTVDRIYCIIHYCNTKKLCFLKSKTDGDGITAIKAEYKELIGLNKFKKWKYIWWDLCSAKQNKDKNSKVIMCGCVSLICYVYPIFNIYRIYNQCKGESLRMDEIFGIGLGFIQFGLVISQIYLFFVHNRLSIDEIMALFILYVTSELNEKGEMNSKQLEKSVSNLKYIELTDKYVHHDIASVILLYLIQ